VGARYGNHGNRDALTEVWDGTSGKRLCGLPGMRPVFTADGRFLATVDWRDIIRVWRVAAFTEQTAFGFNRSNTWYAFSSDGQRIYTAESSSGVSVYNMSGEQIASLKLPGAVMVLEESGGLMQCLYQDFKLRRAYLYRWDYRVAQPEHPFLVQIEFWLLLVLGIAFLVSLTQDIRHFRRVRKAADAAREAAVQTAL
jgi:hypothetical protein